MTKKFVGILVGGAALAVILVGTLGKRLFGPPAVRMVEKYAADPTGKVVDHGRLDLLLSKHVDEDGWVDYVSLGQDADQLQKYIASLQELDFDQLGRNEKLALLINAYNAFTLKLILEYYPVESIHDIPRSKRWIDERWKVGKRTLSLDQIEHELLRPNFKEPRIHFAIVCASVSCSPLRNEAYQGASIDSQLDDQAKYMHQHSTWMEMDAYTVRLSAIYRMYQGDFLQVSESPLRYASRFSAQLSKRLTLAPEPTLKFLKFDWRLNQRQNKFPR